MRRAQKKNQSPKGDQSYHNNADKDFFIETIPMYLRPFVARQNYSLYTPMDHAQWRYIMRVSKKFFSTRAHQKYLDGLEQTGISIEQIPRIEEMDQKLSRFGWRAVAVVGFIPPSVFMEFLSLGLLPIACDMRNFAQIDYTPAPDIVHEAAGHAPIISDPEYAAYLKRYGEVSRKVIFSDQDMKVYDAIRELSEVKEQITSTPEQVQRAEEKLSRALEQVTYVSEATKLARMSWWTIEYGLVESLPQMCSDENKKEDHNLLSEPKIYGAGLLSSVRESYHCAEVKKIPFSMKCIEMPYDITKPQPQLFVTKSFQELTEVLGEFEKTLSFRMGGSQGIQTALKAKTLNTVEFESGVSASGILSEIIWNEKEEKSFTPAYLRFVGPTQLAFRGSEIEGQGPLMHRDGFGMPMGKVFDRGKWVSPYSLSFDLMNDLLMHEGRLLFDSGIELTGELVETILRDTGAVIHAFHHCHVRHEERILFDPAYAPPEGRYDLVCGEQIVSVYGGAADRERYYEKVPIEKPKLAVQKTNLTNENKDLNNLYAELRDIREKKMSEKEISPLLLADLYRQFKALKNTTEDWLFRLELLEFDALDSRLRLEIKNELLTIATKSQAIQEMIERGLEV